MFTVKAEVRTLGGGSFELYQAARINVDRPQNWPSNVTPPNWLVQMLDDSGNIIRSLEVGHAISHYHAIYVMNERGKTIQTIWRGPGPDDQNEPVTAQSAAA